MINTTTIFAITSSITTPSAEIPKIRRYAPTISPPPNPSPQQLTTWSCPCSSASLRFSSLTVLCIPSVSFPPHSLPPLGKLCSGTSKFMVSADMSTSLRCECHSWRRAYLTCACAVQWYWAAGC
eukprot:825553-Rhodomonas_salina.1